MKKTLFFLLISLTTIAQQPKQMRSSTEGFSIALNGNYLGWSSDFFSVLDQEEPNGLGIGLHVGYGINEHLEIIGRYDRSNLAQNFEWDYFNYNNAGLAVRFNFGSTTKRIRPFLELGGSQSRFSASPIQFNNQLVDYDLKGFGVSYSGGLNLFITRNLSVELAALGVSGKFNSFLIDGSSVDATDVDGSNFRIKAGIRFSFKDL